MIGLYGNFPNPVFAVFTLVGLIVGVTLILLSMLGAVFIRKDCYQCRFAFHILAHEQSHLSLNSLDEFAVEESTLKNTYGKLIPLLLQTKTNAKVTAALQG